MLFVPIWMIARIISSIKQAKLVIAPVLIIAMDTANVRIVNAFVTRAGPIMTAQ